MFKNYFFFCLLLFTALKGQCQNGNVFRDENASEHDRITALLNVLTIDEKISLLWTTSPAIARLDIDKYNHGNEALHGVVRPGKFTVFPQAIGLASMWNPELHFKVATTISDEARARWNELGQGNKQLNPYSDLLTFWSPTVNMARDPRWGRTPETYGEDPFLSGVLGVQFIKGLQGNNPDYLKVVATPKHFAANNEEHNRFECNPQISEKNLREYYLPAFETCVKDGKSAAIMTAYNAINNVPCAANSWLIQKVLRNEWGFNGYVVSDCGAPEFLVTQHKFVKTKVEAATAAIKAGLDLECDNNVFMEPLKQAYEQGMVSKADIDSAAYHVLRARMRLGLFDDPAKNPYNKLSPEIIGSVKHQEIALEAACQSIVLLKNVKKTLPLHLDKIKSIAVVGINAGNCEFGDYSGTPVADPVSVLQGIQNRVGDTIKVIYSPWLNFVDNSFELISGEYFPDGLKAEYFLNKDLSGEPKIRIDDWISFEPANQAPDPFLPKSPLSIRWKGKLQPVVSGLYTLGFSSDDGCRLFINGNMVIDSWRNRGNEMDTIQISLKAGEDYEVQAEYFDVGGETVAKMYWKTPYSKSKERPDLFADAVKAAKNSDLTIAVLGINKSIEREGQDRKDIQLPIDQQEFIREIYKTNPNTIVVLVAGSSLAINWIDENIPAIIDAWYPGEQGGTAVAKVLFGDYNPAGRLPLTFYKTLNDLPLFDDYDVTKGRTYQYFKGIPLYPFGYGLSYTSFSYSDINIKDLGDNISIRFKVKNSGELEGDEVAQLYVKMPDSVSSAPIKQLKGFKRISIKKGQTHMVEIIVKKENLRSWDEKKSMFVTPKGKYVFMVGSSSESIHLKAELTLN
jgi:beta-glucosidase